MSLTKSRYRDLGVPARPSQERKLTRPGTHLEDVGGPWLHHELAQALAVAARDTTRVGGLTHNHYKYPARFSPTFVRRVIETFTNPGDLVLDPFVGGGTTAVEALALGRDFVGTDISSLATFVTEAKTALVSDQEAQDFRQWALLAPAYVNMAGNTVDFATGVHEGYYRNIENKRFWRIRKAVEQALATTIPLSGNVEMLARCAVLRTAQWALDGRAKLPSVEEFRRFLAQTARTIVEGSEALRLAVKNTGLSPRLEVLQQPASGLQELTTFKNGRAPKLILTSPPYPGVHVLYHRWQVDGRKETPAPFLIAGRLDGSGESYYTLGHRRNPGLRTYWENLENAMRSAAAVCNNDTVIVQVVAFAEPEWQLPRYLEVCRESGLDELHSQSAEEDEGRLWRQVPGRRWYADLKGTTPGSREVVLFHRLR